MAGSTTTAATEQKAHEDERYGLDPDLVVFAKGVTSGYAPLGGVLLSPPVRQPFCRGCEQTPVFRHGATHAGHATASALALALALRNIDILEEEKLLPRVAELEVLLTEELTRLRFREAVTDTRVAGLLGGVTLASHLSAETGTDELIERGFVTRPLRGNTVQSGPPFITTDDELRQLVAAVDTAQEST